MRPDFLATALAVAIVAPAAWADTITVVTSFPKELTGAYKAAYERRYPRQGRDPE
jgi:phosphoglycerate transport regulatory protein PgtC